MTFKEHKESTASDCEAVAKMLTDLAADIREGNFQAFERWWWEDGTEEGDPKIAEIRERLILRYVFRQEKVEENETSPNS